VIWGSPLYISPEQAAGKAPSPATDIYALGVVGYEMLTGRLPFEAKDAAELTRMHRMHAPPHLIQINPSVPLELNRIVLRCLEKEPGDRFASAQQVEDALASIELNSASLAAKDLPHPPIVKAEQTPEAESPKPDLATIWLALVALIMGGGLIPFWLYVILSLNSINR
jgi:serine/threonine-protein kinase